MIAKLQNLKKTVASLACLGMLSGLSANAAVWYVDNAASGSANNGTSWANAWTSLGNIAWASVHAGDTIYISGGSSSKTYNETLTLGASGTSGSRITIKVGQDAGHNGRAIIDAQNVRGSCVNVGSRTFVTLSGDNGTGSTNIVLQNSTSTDRFTGVGVSASGGSANITFDHLEINNVNNGMNINTGAGMIVQFCNIHGIRGDRAIGISGNDVYDSCIVSNCIIQLNYDTPGFGPDGIQGGNGVTVTGNWIHSGPGSTANGQHMDGVQCIGNHWKIYNNRIEDMANAAIEPGTWGSSWNNIMIYNNVWAQTFAEANIYKKGIDFTPNSAITYMSNIFVVNNTAVDLTWRAIYFSYSPYNPSIVNFVVENNIFYGCGRNDPSYAMQIIASSAASQSDYTIDYNLVNSGGGGSTTLNVNGAGFTQAHPRTGVPQFVSYSTYNAANNYHLKSTDTAAMNQGNSAASAWIPAVDRDGVSRPQGSAWDIGAYEFASGGGGGSSNLPPTVSAISHNATDVDPNVSGVQVYEGTTVQYSGSASDPNGDTLTWQWIYTVNGGAEVVFQNGVGSVLPVSFTYPGGSGGSTYVWKLRVNDGTVSAESQVTIGVETPAGPALGLTFEAEAGQIAAPFTTTGGYIYQTTQTSVTAGGRAAYSFSITNAGNYIVQGMVNAPNDGANSFFVNIDAEPTDPTMIWQIPLTSGFESRIVSWQGAGTFDNPQFVPKIFNLTQGSHQLVVRGREANTQLDRISILAVPLAPQGLRVLSNVVNSPTFSAGAGQ